MRVHPAYLLTLIFLAGLGTTLLAACSPRSAAPQAALTPADLQIQELEPGAGEPITGGHIAVVHYTGWLYESAAPDHKGREFDSSQRAGQPFRFALGTGQVIKGWDQGVAGMRVGGRRRLVVPPALAYGDEGAGGLIPPGATLVFDVELLGIE